MTTWVTGGRGANRRHIPWCPNFAGCRPSLETLEGYTVLQIILRQRLRRLNNNMSGIRAQGVLSAFILSACLLGNAAAKYRVVLMSDTHCIGECIMHLSESLDGGERASTAAAGRTLRSSMPCRTSPDSLILSYFFAPQLALYAAFCCAGPQYEVTTLARSAAAGAGCC